MAWFKVDDNAAFHPKIVRAGNAAFGAWIRLGAYCAAQLTDGFIPEQVARMIATKRELDTLAICGLLRDDSGGFLIHDYLEYQPSRDHVLAEREATRARVSRHRNGVGNGVTNTVGNTVGNTAPSHPIPSHPHRTEETKTRAKRSVFDFEAAYLEYPRKEGKSAGMLKCQREIKTEEDYTALKTAIGHYAAKCAAEQTEQKYIKQFSSFMSCWRDYVDAPKGTNGAKRGFHDPRPHIPETYDEDLSK